MASFVFANFIKTTLAASLSSSATSMSVADAIGIPSLSTGEQLGFVLNDAATGLLFEVVYVTAVSGTTLTILRGQEGTSAQNWNVGDYVANTVTASQLAAMVQGNGSQFAPAAGNGSQVFAVADATAATQQAVPIIQADARYAPIAGSSGQTFEVADATTAHQATSLEQIQATYAPLISPALTGTPTAPTASAGTSSTQVATTANVVASIAAGWATPGAIGSTTPNTGAFTTLTADDGTTGNEVVTYGQVANTAPVSQTNVTSGTIVDATTGTLTAPSTGIAVVFADGWNSVAGSQSPVLTASLSGLVTSVAVGYATGFIADGYLPMTAGQASTFTAGFSSSSSGDLLVRVRAIFVPLG